MLFLDIGWLVLQEYVVVVWVIMGIIPFALLSLKPKNSFENRQEVRLSIPGGTADVFWQLLQL